MSSRKGNDDDEQYNKRSKPMPNLPDEERLQLEELAQRMRSNSQSSSSGQSLGPNIHLLQQELVNLQTQHTVATNTLQLAQNSLQTTQAAYQAAQNLTLATQPILNQAATTYTTHTNNMLDSLGPVTKLDNAVFQNMTNSGNPLHMRRTDLNTNPNKVSALNSMAKAFCFRQPYVSIAEGTGSNYHLALPVGHNIDQNIVNRTTTRLRNISNNTTLLHPDGILNNQQRRREKSRLVFANTNNYFANEIAAVTGVAISAHTPIDEVIAKKLLLNNYQGNGSEADIAQFITQNTGNGPNQFTVPEHTHFTLNADNVYAYISQNVFNQKVNANEITRLENDTSLQKATMVFGAKDDGNLPFNARINTVINTPPHNPIEQIAQKFLQHYPDSLANNNQIIDFVRDYQVHGHHLFTDQELNTVAPRDHTNTRNVDRNALNQICQFIATQVYDNVITPPEMQRINENINLNAAATHLVIPPHGYALAHVEQLAVNAVVQAGQVTQDPLTGTRSVAIGLANNGNNVPGCCGSCSRCFNSMNNAVQIQRSADYENNMPTDNGPLLTPLLDAVLPNQNDALNARHQYITSLLDRKAQITQVYEHGPSHNAALPHPVDHTRLPNNVQAFLATENTMHGNYTNLHAAQQQAVQNTTQLHNNVQQLQQNVNQAQVQVQTINNQIASKQHTLQTIQQSHTNSHSSHFFI